MSKLYRALKRSIRSIHKTEYEKRTGKRDYKYRFYDLYCAFMDTCFYSWHTPIRVFWESLVRTARWFPIIWKDRHWDHGFILEILRHKIRFTRECIGKYNRHTTVEQDCHNMRIAEILLKRIQEDNYGDSFMEEHEAKWGKLQWDKWVAEEDDVMFDNKFSKRGLQRVNVRSQKDWDQESKEHKRIIDHCHYQKNQDYDYLFKHLKKHLERWWD